MSEESSADGPDFRQGVLLDRLADGQMLLGHVAGEPALLVRRAEGLFAVGATCTHYGGPLVEGLLVDDTVRCPWHHACFSLRTGAALRPPALNGLPRWRVEQRDGMAFVCEPLPAAVPPTLAAAHLPASIVIIGGGASGNAAAETLRQEGYRECHHTPKRRLIIAMRSAQSVKRLSRRDRAGRLDPVTVTGILFAAWYRSQACNACHGDRTNRADSRAVGWDQAFLRRAAAGHRRRTDQAEYPGSLVCRMCTCSARSPTAMR